MRSRSVVRCQSERMRFESDGFMPCAPVLTGRSLTTVCQTLDHLSNAVKRLSNSPLGQRAAARQNSPAPYQFTANLTANRSNATQEVDSVGNRFGFRLASRIIVC